MVTQPRHYFEALLGISAPWSVQDVAIDEKTKTLQIHLGYAIEKSIFSFFPKSIDTNSNTVTDNNNSKKWVYPSLGDYRCIVNSRYYDQQTVGIGITKQALSQPHFLGDADKNYTHELRSRVAAFRYRDSTPECIAYTLGVDLNVVETIIDDIERTSDTYRLATCLPSPSNAIWLDLINDRLHLKSQVFSLKLLLSKLKLTTIDPKVDTKPDEAIAELRKFFIAHTATLEQEISQICALPQQRVQRELPQTGITKLVLPSLKNGIWLKIITGKIDLSSSNMPLNLFLVRLRHAFQNTQDNTLRIDLLNQLREFFRKNARTLKQELILINRLINSPDEQPSNLPNEQHDVWRRILKDDGFIPSSYIAYKLLLSNLRSQILMNPDPTVELNAVRRVRDFIKHNERFMQHEVRQVLNNSY